MQEHNKTSLKIGNELVRLRLNAGLKQAEVAEAMKIDTSRVSRIETGELLPDEEEVKKFAKAVSTSEAKEFSEYFAADWKCVEKSGFWHPARRELGQAANFLTSLATVLAGH